MHKSTGAQGTTLPPPTDLPSRRSERRRRVVESSIRTKLTAVILQVELALERGDNDRLRDCLHAALDAAWAADALLD